MGKKETSQRTKGLIAAIICYTIFGFSYIFSRIALSHAEPEVMLTVRFGVALAAMSILILFRVVKINLKGKPILPLIALGMCQPVLYFFCESYGIKYTNASFAGMMIALVPVVSSILSAIFLKEPIRMKKMLWILGSVVGAVIVTIAGSASGTVSMLGLAFIFGAVFIAALFGVISRSNAEKFTAIEMTYMMLVIGFISFLIVTLFKEGSNSGTVFRAALTDKYVMLPILYLSILSSIVAFFMQNYSLGILSVQTGMVFANLVPVVSSVAGVLILNEPFTWIHIIGMVIIIVSIFMVNKADSE